MKRIYVDYPTSRDILMRTNGVTHRYNQRYERILASCVEEYSKAADKFEFRSALYLKLQALDLPMRFLQYDNTAEKYFAVTETGMGITFHKVAKKLSERGTTKTISAIYVNEVTASDILFWDDGFENKSHTGNLLLRRMLEPKVKAYQSTEHQFEMCSKVFWQLKKENSSTRFLRRCGEKQKCCLCNKEYSVWRIQIILEGMAIADCPPVNNNRHDKLSKEVFTMDKEIPMQPLATSTGPSGEKGIKVSKSACRRKRRKVMKEQIEARNLKEQTGKNNSMAAAETSKAQNVLKTGLQSAAQNKRTMLCNENDCHNANLPNPTKCPFPRAALTQAREIVKLLSKPTNDSLTPPDAVLPMRCNDSGQKHLRSGLVKMEIDETKKSLQARQKQTVALSESSPTTVMKSLLPTAKQIQAVYANPKQLVSPLLQVITPGQHPFADLASVNKVPRGFEKNVTISKPQPQVAVKEEDRDDVVSQYNHRFDEFREVSPRVYCL
ncbi:unnamed protein product [Cylindrotheca closterium]|uniref:Uncharacterized protein n=1 Tax=Cylindrotheca closterium TaxID=2856 RepID=A0AAD2FH10_9STRA|nr:unnamed protein product [Cylindrotheca closterium]